jgi:threonine/homoserine/homoserine lactone efflux protein
MTAALLAAVGALALLTVLPGADFAIVVRWSAAGGFRSGVLAALGVITGCSLWGALTIAGLAALFTASPVAYEVVRVVGAGYLVWMAARMIGKSFRRTGETDAAPAVSGRVPYRQGMVTNLLNPKIAAFYVGVLPVLVPAAAPHALTMAGLVVVHQVLGIVWLTLVAALVARGRNVLSRPAARRWLDRVTGVVLLGFAGRLALDAA